MWYDAQARLLEIQARPPATLATPATNTGFTPPRVAEVAVVAAPGTEIAILPAAAPLDLHDPALAHDLAEERAAIMELEAGPPRTEAEALAGVTPSRMIWCGVCREDVPANPWAAPDAGWAIGWPAGLRTGSGACPVQRSWAATRSRNRAV